MLFGRRFRVNCDIHSFRSIDSGRLVPLSAHLIEHWCTAKKQHQRSSQALLYCSGYVLGEKHTQQDKPAAITDEYMLGSNILGTFTWVRPQRIKSSGNQSHAPDPPFLSTQSQVANLNSICYGSLHVNSALTAAFIILACFVCILSNSEQKNIGIQQADL